MKQLKKAKMIFLMKSQFEYFSDLDANTNMFEYISYDQNSERLRYCDDYGNIHDLYHGIVAGKEVLLYHMNNERNQSLAIPKETRSVIHFLKNYEQKVSEQPKGNNLEPQRSDQER